MIKKREIIIYTSGELTKEERKKYKKENPGKRLCFRLRYPDFPIYFSMFSLIASVVVVMMLLMR